MSMWQSMLSFFAGFVANDSYKDTVKDLETLITSARESIWLVAGRLEAGVFANAGVLNAIKKAIGREKPVKIRILTGPTIDEGSAQLLQLARENPDKIEILRLGFSPNGHFTIIDGKHVRVEEYHEPSALQRKALTRYNTLFLAERMGTEFRKLVATTQHNQ